MAGREVLLLSVAAGHSLHMHTLMLLSNTRLVSPLTGKKYPKCIAKKVPVVKQTVHNLQTGTFKAKGIDQQKRFQKVFKTVLKPPKKAVYEGRWGGLDMSHSFLLSQPTQGPLCYNKT